MPKLIPKTGEGNGPPLEMRAGRYYLGSSAEADFQLDHSSVAELHCEIEVTDDAMTVKDLGSMSGTYINGQPVREARIDSGQVLRVGDVEFQVEGAPVRIVVPTVSGPERVWQIELTDGSASCARHHSERGVAECTKCKRVWCTHCLRRVGLQGKKPLRLCPECGAVCGPVRRRVKVVKKGFFARLWEFLFGWLRRGRAGGK